MNIFRIDKLPFVNLSHALLNFAIGRASVSLPENHASIEKRFAISFKTNIIKMKKNGKFTFHVLLNVKHAKEMWNAAISVRPAA